MVVPGIGWGFDGEGIDSEIAFEMAAVSFPRRTSNTRNVRTESSIETAFPAAMPEGTLWETSGEPVDVSLGSMTEVLVTLGDRGASRGASTGVSCVLEVVAEKGPVLEVAVAGDSVSEPLSRAGLSLRSRFRTRALLERLCTGLSAISASMPGEVGQV